MGEHSPVDVAVDLYHRDCPKPPSAGDRRASRFGELVRLWDELVEPFIPGDGDFESWVENIERTRAAISAYGREHCWVGLHRRPSDGVVFRNVATGQVHPDPDSLTRWGPVAWRGTPVRAGGIDPDAYATTETFARHAGRPFRLVAADGDDLTAALYAMAEHDPHRRVWAKVISTSKYAVGELTVPDPGVDSGRSVFALLRHGDNDPDTAEGIGGALVHYEGDDNVFLIAPRTTMEYQYRFFCVDGVPVTGAACIESHTPLDSTNLAFDPVVEQVRGSKDAQRRPDLVEKMHDFAVRVGAELYAEGMRHFTLDVALGADGEPLVIECNDLPNAGLYACDPQRLLRALRRSPHPYRTVPRKALHEPR